MFARARTRVEDLIGAYRQPELPESSLAAMKEIVERESLRAEAAVESAAASTRY